MIDDPLDRFSGKSGGYARHRPAYPEALFTHPEVAPRLRNAVVADIGAGTGIFSRLLAAHSATVVAIEPNADMRARAQADLASLANCRIQAGTAEATGLDPASVDLVTAAQAFHWFDAERFRIEARRILRPGGQVILVWNRRDAAGSPAMRDYDAVIERHLVKPPVRRTLDQVAAFFPEAPQVISIHWQDACDREGLIGRAASSSTLPERGQPGHAALAADLEACFDRYHQDGRWLFSYRCEALLGRP